MTTNSTETAAKKDSFKASNLISILLIVSLLVSLIIYYQWSSARANKQFNEELQVLDSSMSTSMNKLLRSIKKGQSDFVTMYKWALLTEASDSIATCENALRLITAIQTTNPTAFQDYYGIFTGTDGFQKPESLKIVLNTRLTDVLIIHKELIKTFDEGPAQQHLYQKIIDAEKQLTSMDGGLQSMQSAFDVIKANHAEVEHMLETIE